MQNILHTVCTTLISDTCEVQAFNDDHIEIQDPGRDFQEVPTLPQICLNRDEARELRNFLNSIEL